MNRLNAFGQTIKPLCFAPEQDELLALGYPHLARLVDAPLGAKKSDADAIKAATHFNALARYRGVWPREVANRFVRLAKTPWFQDWTSRAPSAADLPRSIDGGLLAEDEARSILQFSAVQEGSVHAPRITALNFLLEAMVGTEVVVDAILCALESIPDRFRKSPLPDRQLGGQILDVGFMLLRLAPERRAHHRARLEALWDAHHAGSVAWEVITPLHRVLHGDKAFSGPISPYDYLDWHIYVEDVPHLHEIIARKSAIYTGLDVRFVYLAGPEVLGLLGKHRPQSAGVMGWLEDIGMIRHEAVVTLMMEYIGKPSAKTKPLDWLREHASFAAPLLEGMAKRQGTSAQKANAVLKALDA